MLLGEAGYSHSRIQGSSFSQSDGAKFDSLQYPRDFSFPNLPDVRLLWFSVPRSSQQWSWACHPPHLNVCPHAYLHYADTLDQQSDMGTTATHRALLNTNNANKQLRLASEAQSVVADLSHTNTRLRISHLACSAWEHLDQTKDLERRVSVTCLSSGFY